MTQPITPTQADREAAAKWAKSNSRHAQAANIRRGSCDTAPLVQAFARHAAAAREEVAEIIREAIASGYPEPARKVDTCKHGKFGWEDCINCYDDHLEAALERALQPTIAGGRR